MAAIDANRVRARREPVGTGMWFGAGIGHEVRQDNFSRRLSTQRKPNFTREENLYMIEMFEKHKSLLKSKLMNSSVTRRKLEVWSSICTQLNKRNSYVKRSVDEVKRRWKNLIYFARKRQAAGHNHSRILANTPTINSGDTEEIVVWNRPISPLSRLKLEVDERPSQSNDDSVEAAAILVMEDDGTECDGQGTSEWKHGDDNNDEQCTTLVQHETRNLSGFAISSVVSIRDNDAESPDNGHWFPDRPNHGMTASKRTLSQSHRSVQHMTSEGSHTYNSVGAFENEQDTMVRTLTSHVASVAEPELSDTINTAIVSAPISYSRYPREYSRSMKEGQDNGLSPRKRNQDIGVRIKREREDEDQYGLSSQPHPQTLFVNSGMPVQQCSQGSRVNPVLDPIRNTPHTDVVKLQMDVLQLERDKLLMEKQNLALENEKLKYQVLFWKKRSESEIAM